ncbi:MAG: class I SAM-dependent methyltransferase [Mycobacteriales bacterium]
MTTAREQAAQRSWYHTIDLGGGLITNGWFDLRPYLHHYGLPERLDGQRVLDVGTWDGFWAFEMERRGAAEIVAIDLDDEAMLDWPPRRRPPDPPREARGTGFLLAKEILDSSVQRITTSIYHAGPEQLGTFDFVICGSVLGHLRDQFLALERIANLCRGRLLLAEFYDRAAGWLPGSYSRYLADREQAVVFWLPSARTWRRMTWSAGFDEVREHDRFVLRDRTRSFGVRHTVIHASKQHRDPLARLTC